MKLFNLYKCNQEVSHRWKIATVTKHIGRQQQRSAADIQQNTTERITGNALPRNRSLSLTVTHTPFSAFIPFDEGLNVPFHEPVGVNLTTCLKICGHSSPSAGRGCANRSSWEDAICRCVTYPPLPHGPQASCFRIRHVRHRYLVL